MTVLMKAAEMNALNQAAAQSQTQPNKVTATVASVSRKRKVTYILDTTKSSASLKMPYALAINGKAHADFRLRAFQVSGNKGKITVTVDAGQQVSLYLNSDAHPDFRQEPVYAVTPSDNDIEVHITEKTGKHADTDTPVLKSKAAKLGDSDQFSAPLTGDIWLKISHKYTATEAGALIPMQTAPEIKAAVLKYYDGTLTKASSSNKITLPAKDGQPAKSCQIDVSDGADKNALENIQRFDLFADGLPRVHPLGFLALIEAAFDAGIEKLALTSTWRPMTGSVAHRAGLGLDVNYLDSTRLNREELRGKKPTKDADDNVSEEEKKLFKEKEEAEAEAEKAETELKKLQAEQKALLALKKTQPNKANPTREIQLDREITEAKEKAAAANNKAKEKNEMWNKERDKNEPAKVVGYRASLSQCKHVKQLYDPWFMDDDTQDKIPAKPNEQKTRNEKLHAHHLHITVHEPKIR